MTLPVDALEPEDPATDRHSVHLFEIRRFSLLLSFPSLESLRLQVRRFLCSLDPDSPCTTRRLLRRPNLPLYWQFPQDHPFFSSLVAARETNTTE